MRWQTGRRSSNVDDRRGRRTQRRIGGGIGTLLLILAALYFGIDPTPLLQGLQVESVPDSTPAPRSAEENQLAEFVAVVLGDTEDVWRAQFELAGANYQDPVLVLFTDAVRSACGMGSAAMGPFYCPGDQKIYIDLGFYRDLRQRFQAPGDFAQAYVIAHEVGHHVQNLLGISGEVAAQRQRASTTVGNQLSVRLELQADCLAGVWANLADQSRGILESGDIDEALRAASAIGDDRIQQESSGRVVPDSFTHGSSEQRVRWFRRGLEAGTADACDTFDTDRL